MEWFKKHMDMVVIVSVLFGGWWNINGRFVDLDKRMNQLDNRLVRIETVLIMQKIMPNDLAFKAD